MRLADIWTLYRFELRAAFRERGIVVSSVLIPIMLYPLMLWVVSTGMSFVQGLNEATQARVAIIDLPDAHERFSRVIRRNEEIKIVDDEFGLDAARDAIASGRLDAAIVFLPPKVDDADLAENFRAEIVYDASRRRSETAKGRAARELEAYRERWINERRRTAGVTDSKWLGFRIEGQDDATSEQFGALLLGMILPMFLVYMIGLGCFYPAVDTTAGERERSTWETLMTVSASRLSIVAAKYLYVATMGLISGMLNLVAMMLTVGPVFKTLFEDASRDIHFDIPLAAFPAMFLGATLLALLIAAMMMIVAAFARDFKEGQSMLGPVYILFIVPPIFLQSPGIEFTPGMALVPVANVIMLFREALAGHFHALPIALTVLSQGAAIGFCLWLATVILRFEDVLMGSYGGSFLAFVKGRLLRRTRSEKETT